MLTFAIPTALQGLPLGAETPAATGLQHLLAEMQGLRAVLPGLAAGEGGLGPDGAGLVPCGVCRSQDA